MLKGWFERVFSGGWAYNANEKGQIIGNMRDVHVLLVATTAGSESGYERLAMPRLFKTRSWKGFRILRPEEYADRLSL